MKRIIVTGATSCIAAALIKKLLKDDEAYIYAVVRPGSRNIGRLPTHRNIQIVELDIKDYYQMKGICQSGIDMFFHLAWEGVRGKQREDAELQEKNYEASKKCLESSVTNKVPLFIGVGSQAEYGISDQVTYEDDVLLHPNTEYGKMKAKTYKMGMQLCEGTQTRFVWARIFSIYSKDDDQNTLLMQCIRKMKNNESIDLSPCEHLWDYTYIDDAVEAVWLLSEKNVRSGAYNISYGQPRPLKQYVIELKELMKSESLLNFGAISYGKHSPVQLIPSVRKIKEATGWTPKIDFKTGMKEILEGG